VKRFLVEGPGAAEVLEFAAAYREWRKVALPATR
jgi:hypothetical protein